VAEARFGWPGASSRGFRDGVLNMGALRHAAAEFRPHVLHSFSRLAYLVPLLSRPLPKVMSYQRFTGGMQIRIGAWLGGNSLRFTALSDFIRGMGEPSGGRWTTIFNFVDLQQYSFAPEVAPDAPLVFLSRIESIKGPQIAIAIARACGRRLILAGNRAESGPEAVFFESEVAPHLGRDGVEWVGEVNDAQKRALLASAAALLVPIQWDEPFGIVFAEALAAGTPVITCARGALPEILEPGRTGFFIGGVSDGAGAVRRIGELDRAACRRAVETRFSLDVCARQYLALYEAMISEVR
jgi:glycosyltransferase involved in cell wall biosynthesis